MHFSLHDWQPKLIALAEEFACNDGAHDIGHLHRVWRTAQTLLDAHPEADALIVLASCYLHDLVNLPKNHAQRHTASKQAARLACRQLEALRFPAGKLAGLAHAIEAHSFSAGIPPATIEAKIVQDADRLDALGAVGLARLFYTAGRMGSRLAHPDDAQGARRTLDDRQYALDHIACKLETLPASMQTVAGRRLGEQRMQWLRDFRSTFAAEWNGVGAA